MITRPQSGAARIIPALDSGDATRQSSDEKALTNA